MNPRERLLLGVLFAVLGIGGTGAAFYFFFYRDYVDLSRQVDADAKKLDEKKASLEAAEKEQAGYFKRNPRLKDWKEISLPDIPGKSGAKHTPEETVKHLNKLQGDYQANLNALLIKHRFDPIDIQAKTPDTKPVDGKGGGSLAKDKVPLYTRLPFSVKATATYGDIIAMLKDFHNEPLLQEVRTLSITRPQTARQSIAPQLAVGAAEAPAGLQGFGQRGGQPGFGQRGGQPGGRGGQPGGRQGGSRDASLLDVTMTVEVLMVTGAETRSELMPKIQKGSELVLAQPPRDYNEMLAKDPFFGKRVGTTGDKVVLGPSEKPEQVLPFVKLTMIAQEGTRRWQATFYNQGTGDENPVSLLNDEIIVHDLYGQETFVGKLVHLDGKELVFKDKAGEHFYLMHIGDVMQTAMKNPLKPKDLEKYGLAPKKLTAVPE